MSESIYDIAASAVRALRRKPRSTVKIVSDHCEICGKTHRMGLGSPRCTAPAPVVPISRENPAYEPIFGKVLAMALLVGCMALSGCGVVADLKTKSTNMNVSGIGGSLASVDPATGTVAPTVKVGIVDTSIMNHLPGDGTQVSIITSKSFWSSEIGTQSIKINGQGPLPGFTFTYAPGGNVALSFDDGAARNTSAAK